MQRTAGIVIAIVFTAFQGMTFGQAGPGKSPGAAYFTVEDQQALYSHTVPDKTYHQGALVVDAGDYNIGINAQHQVGDFGEVGTRWNFHEKCTEIYFVVEGTADSLTVGGPMSDVKMSPYSTDKVRAENGQGMAGPGGSAAFSQKAVTRRVKKGDVLVIPPVHRSRIDERVQAVPFPGGAG